MSFVRRLLLLLLLLLPLTELVAAPPANALSCVGPESAAAGSTVLFTGRIRDFRDERFLVEVDEVWRGEVEPEVWLATDSVGFWSDMKSFRSGTIPEGYSSETTFVFAPHQRKNGLTVNVCTMWDTLTPWNQDLAKFRPKSPLRPSAALPTPLTETEDATKPLSNDELRLRKLGAGAAAVVLVGGAALLLRLRRNREPRGSDEA